MWEKMNIYHTSSTTVAPISFFRLEAFNRETKLGTDVLQTDEL